MWRYSHLAPALLVLLSATSVAQTPASSDGASALYERGLRQMEAGQFERARLSFQTLLNTEPASPLGQRARAAIRTSYIRQGNPDPDPMLLFQEAQARAKAGKLEAARLAYQTLINLYPTSEYANRARQAME